MKYFIGLLFLIVAGTGYAAPSLSQDASDYEVISYKDDAVIRRQFIATAIGGSGEGFRFAVFNKTECPQGSSPNGKICKLYCALMGNYLRCPLDQAGQSLLRPQETFLIQSEEASNGLTLQLSPNFKWLGTNFELAPPSSVEDPAGAPDETDWDSDSLSNESDNCPQTPNADQADADGDHVGDVCDVGGSKNFSGSANGEEDGNGASGGIESSSCMSLASTPATFIPAFAPLALVLGSLLALRSALRRR